MEDRKKALTDMMSDDEKSGLYMEEQSPVEWLEYHYKKQMEIHGEIHSILLDDLFGTAKQMEEKLKDFETWKEWKNKQQ
jgi:hypothetical protein